MDEINGIDPGAMDGREDAGQDALDGLIENSRIQVEGTILAKDGFPLPPEQIEQVVAAFRRHCDENKLSVKQAAKEIGYGPATLSEWQAGRYKGDTSAVTRKVNEWLERDARRRQAQRPSDFISTRVAEAMKAMIQLADKLPAMCAIAAPSGSGKTKVLYVLVEQMNGIYVCCTPGMIARDLYRKLADELGWRKEKGTRTELLNFIIGKLAGTRRLIAIDEAHLLGKQIGCLRPIFDLAKVPIAMAGARQILGLIDEDRAHGFGQFSSRCLRFDCTETGAAGAGTPGRHAPAMLFSKEEIARFLNSKKMRFTREALDLFWALANLAKYGTLRLVETLAYAVVNSNPDLKAIRREDLISALGLVAGDMAATLSQDAGEFLEGGQPAVAQAG